MKLRVTDWSLGVRLGLAGAMISVVLVLAAQHLFPELPPTTLWAYSWLAMLTLAALVVGGFFAGAMVNQAVLQKGGTDTQWFWFSSEPKGLQELRADSSKDGAGR